MFSNNKTASTFCYSPLHGLPAFTRVIEKLPSKRKEGELEIGRTHKTEEILDILFKPTQDLQISILV